MPGVPNAVERQALTVYQALTGNVPKYEVFKNLTAFVSEFGEAGFASLLTREVSPYTDAYVAYLVVRGVGISDHGVVDHVAATLGAFGPNARGQVLINLVMKVSSLESDPHFGADAARFNQKVAVSYAAAIDPNNTQPIYPTFADVAREVSSEPIVAVTVVGTTAALATGDVF